MRVMEVHFPPLCEQQQFDRRERRVCDLPGGAGGGWGRDGEDQ